MIMEKLFKLPPYVGYQGVTFMFEIFANGNHEVRICYAIDSVDPHSPHEDTINECGAWYNTFNQNKLQTFLYLIEGINTDEDLDKALDECYEFLKEKDLL